MTDRMTASLSGDGRPFAEGTSVSVASSNEELRKLLKRYGADQFAVGEEADRVALQFRADGRMVRFVVPMPIGNEPVFTHAGRRARTDLQRENAVKAEERRRWRCLVLVVKAKLEAVSSAIETFDEAFAAQIVLPSGETVGEWLSPQIEQAYKLGRMPAPMLGLGSGND